MKKIVLLTIIVCFLSSIAWGMEIKTSDNYVYEFRDGIQKAKGVKQTFTYDVDIEKATIKLRGEPDTYKIISVENRNITAIRIRPQGEEMFVFKNDGTYCLFLTIYFPEEAVGVKGFFTNLFFGNYTIKSE